MKKLLRFMLMKNRALTVILMCLLMLCLCACTKIDKSIDDAAAQKIIGEYQAADDSGIDEWWHLSICWDDEDRLYLSIYDNSAGNPGIEGPVVSLDNEQIAMEYDDDYYDKLPSDKWKTDGKYLIMSYSLSEEGITLSNKNADAVFAKEPDMYTISGHWRAPNSDELEDVIIANGTITLKGWQRSTKTREWTNEEKTYVLADDCIFNDMYFEREVIPQDKFQEQLKRKDAEYMVIELDMIGEEVSEVRLVEPDESYLTD